MGRIVRFFDFLCCKSMLRSHHTEDDEEEEAPSDLWSHQLPQDILNLILHRLAAGDHIRLAAACSSLREVVARAEVSSRIEFPLLLYSATNPSQNDHLFSRLGGDKFYSINPVHTKGKRICGNFEGRWLIMVGCNNAETTPFFLNLMTGEKIMLPPQPQPSGADPWFFKRIVASSEPTNSDCLVAALAKPISKGYRLIFCRITDTEWSALDEDDMLKDLPFNYMAFCDGKLYASTPKVFKFLVMIDLRNEVYKAQKLVIGVPRPLLRALSVRKEGSLYHLSLEKYLLIADSVTGELFCIVVDVHYSSKEHTISQELNIIMITGLEVIGLRVLKMDMNHHMWIEINDIGDRILFIGNNGCFFTPVESLGDSIQSNCIYYSVVYDTGRFCLIDKTRVRHLRHKSLSRKYNTCNWFVPKIEQKT